MILRFLLNRLLGGKKARNKYNYGIFSGILYGTRKHVNML